MVRSPYQYVLELFKPDGTRLGRLAAKVDWEPAREFTRFSAIRRGELPLNDAGGGACVQPLWHPEVGEPYLKGFRVGIERNGGGDIASEFPISYFGGLARQASAHFVERGRLQEDEHFRYLVTAYPGSETAAAERGRLEAEEVAPSIPFLETGLGEFLRRAVPAGIVDAEDMPAFIPQEVLAEVAALTEAAEDRETGGFLIGHLHRDARLPEIFAEVTAQIPAEAQGDATKLRFTPATWTAGRAALGLRARQELFLGWWHSHPVAKAWCKDKHCTLDKLRTCTLARDYFSEDDRAVMRAAFPRAYSLGLVATDAPLNQLIVSLFGWRQGQVESRGYYILQR